MPEIIITICAKDASRTLGACLDALWRQVERASEGVVLRVIDHGSSDSTSSLLESWCRKTKDRLEVLSFKGGGLPEVRNFSVQSARHQWLAFVDADCVVQAGWLDAALNAIAVEERSSLSVVAAVGGANSSPLDGDLRALALGLAVSSLIGGGGTPQNRPVSDRRDLGHAPSMNVLYRLRAVREVGGFDSSFSDAGEDVDLSFRLRAAGYLIRSEPGMACVHRQETSFRSWFRKMIRYGKARCRVMARHPSSFEWKYVAPAGLVAAVVAGLLAGIYEVIPTYFALIAVSVLPEAIRRRSTVCCALCASFYVGMIHWGYTLGMLYGLRELVRNTYADRKAAKGDRLHANQL